MKTRRKTSVGNKIISVLAVMLIISTVGNFAISIMGLMTLNTQISKFEILKNELNHKIETESNNLYDMFQANEYDSNNIITLLVINKQTNDGTDGSNADSNIVAGKENNSNEDSGEDEISYVEKILPTGVSGSFKSYMDYRKITDKTSKQWEMQESAITDEYGFRKYNGLYMIALGTYYSPEVGIEVEIELSSGKKIKCITGDIKSNKHTDTTNRYVTTNGNIVEFIVDENKINSKTKLTGDMSSSGMDGDIKNIYVFNS